MGDEVKIPARWGIYGHSLDLSAQGCNASRGQKIDKTSGAADTF